VAAAETGRRVKGGRNVFHASSALLAPVWVMERAVCVWLALAVRALGGVRYSGGRIACAAHSRGQLMAVYAVGRES
jgi:hypothetical protein